MTQSDLLTADEAAKLLSISRRTFDGHVAHGDIAYIAVGLGLKRTRKRFTSDDITQFRDDQRRVECRPMTRTSRSRTRPAAWSEIIDFQALLEHRRAERRAIREAKAKGSGGRPPPRT